MINKTTILLIQDDIQALSELTQKCLEAGISERNIFSVTETESAQRYLEIAGISYVIIDADMYNYVIASTISEFSEYFPIQTVITNAKPNKNIKNDERQVFDFLKLCRRSSGIAARAFFQRCFLHIF